VRTVKLLAGIAVSPATTEKVVELTEPDRKILSVRISAEKDSEPLRMK
jgi:hypothetical protein